MAAKALSLRCVGFCGVDDSVEPLLLRAVSLAHPWVEWGVLFRPELAGTPRYASEGWLAALAEANTAAADGSGRPMRLAGHLCASRVDELLRGDATFVSAVAKQVGFGRFQINATAANGVDVGAFATPEGADACTAAIATVCAACPHLEFILQCNVQTRPLWERIWGRAGAARCSGTLSEAPPNLSLLYDDSMGLGVSCTSWQPPREGVQCGYAGGLSPSNLKSQLTAIGQVADGRPLWVDMESSLRCKTGDGRDVFDANRAVACVRVVGELLGAGVRAAA